MAKPNTSQIIKKSISFAISKKESESDDTLRNKYIEIMGKESEKWVDIFKKEIEETDINDIFDKNNWEKKDEEHEYIIHYDCIIAGLECNGSFEIDNFNKIILIGLKDECDLSICEDDKEKRKKLFLNGISRCHLILWFRKDIGKIFVFDMGSYSGIQTISRSSNNLMQSSKKNSRKTLIFDWGENFQLALRNDKKLIVTISYKTCIICIENPRTVKLNPCGHYLTCKRCTNKLFEENNPQCPLCREYIKEYDNGIMRTKTMGF